MSFFDRHLPCVQLLKPASWASSSSNGVNPSSLLDALQMVTTPGGVVTKQTIFVTKREDEE